MRDAASAIVIVLALGLALRLIIAQQLPGSGFGVDLTAFRYWAQDLATNGPFGFYDRRFFHDYTPGYLYVLWAVGVVGEWLAPLGRSVALPTILGDDLIKVPAIVADLALGWLVWSMTQELGGSRRAAVIGAALVVFNPLVWFDSVVWGQVDSVGVVFLLLGVRELWRDRAERSAVYTVIAAVIKPQLGILIPIVAVVVIRRALFPDGAFSTDTGPSGGERSDGVGRAAVRRGPSSTFAIGRGTRGPLRIVTTLVVAIVTAVALSAPFGLSIVGLMQQVASAAGGYPYVTVNAYNPWALLQLDGSGMAANGTWICDVATRPPAAGGAACTPAYMFGPVPAVAVGAALILLTVAAVCLVVARRPDRRTILVGVAVLAIAFFVVPTRVHERYLFPFYAIAAIAAAVSLRWRIGYAILSAATFANMYVVLTTLYPDNPQIRDWLGIGDAIRSPMGVTVIATAHLVGFLWAAGQLRDRALSRLADEVGGDAAPAGVPLAGAIRAGL